MSIIKDMDLVYDNKMADKENEIHTTTGLEQWGRGNYKRMTPSQRAQWDSYYDPIIKKFKEDKLSGKALAEWKYQRYMHDYMRVIHSVDRNVGRVIEYLRQHGLLDNTMIVYTSDQGFYMGEQDGSTSVSCMKSHSAHHCWFTIRAVSMGLSKRWYRISTMPQPSSM